MLKNAKSIVSTGLATLLPVFVVLVAGFGVESPAYAEKADKNPYDMGIEFYQKGEYANARHYLEHVVNLKPNYWPAHYALGNTYMKLGNLEMAKSAYMNCLNQKPDVPTCKNCSKAMEYLNVAIAEQKAKTDPNSLISPELQKKIAQVEAQAKAETEAHEANVKAATEKRDKILAEGHRQAAAIKAKHEEHLRWIDENTNQYVINRSTGVVRTGLDVDTHAELQAQCDEEVKRVMELAEIRARGIQIPSAPTIGTSIHASNVHSSSNAYVRHYKHPTTNKPGSGQGQSRKLATGTAITK